MLSFLSFPPPQKRLLRVGFASRTSATRKRQYSEIMERGIQIAGRNYEFLTYSASGTRDGKCIFFASSGDDIKDGITADKVFAVLSSCVGFTII